MQRFDCLSRDCPLLGPHLLEASAGTGKTFSIEHIFVRLILESIEVEEILAVTFTRAATRELKARIRTNIEKALLYVCTNDPAWDYLVPYLGSNEAIRRLTDALATFDRCQIFTIHGFCYRMLKEFAFEAKVGALSNPDEGTQIPEKLRQAALDFLENGISNDLLCPEQIALLLKQFDSMDEIAERLLRLEEVDSSSSFSDILAKCKAALQPWNLEESKLLEDFSALEKGYKVQIKGNFIAQIKGLANLDCFPALLKERGTIFDFLDPDNRKVKAQEPKFLHYPGFFDWARFHIAPLVKQKVFPILQSAWNPIGEKILAEEEFLDPDEILQRMKLAVENESFANLIRQKYLAAIIDEFQDTDAVQWEIFQSLFFTNTLRALYLVGDPKQAIYRFRKADVYTYLKARDYLGEKHLYQLDTNFRSSKQLIGALNALFARDWLHLPKVNRVLPYMPVQAGAKIESSFPDQKGALHFLMAEGEPNALFDEVFIPFAAHEIERLNLKKCALLVKDRYQAEKALEYLKSRGIQAIAKSHVPLGQTVAFQSIRELFEAVLSPRDASAAKVVMSGPFAKPDLPFSEYKLLLEEKGLVPFAREFELGAEAMQIFELLFAWEQKEGFSFEGLKRTLRRLRDLNADEGARKRMEVDEEAVQIMTMHISKGLEFDVVFALGLASRTPESEEVEELNAEKLRQLYVAMTRAKKRLYVPLVLSNKDPIPGTHSPMELFSNHFQGSFHDELISLSKTESITIEHLTAPLALPAPSRVQPQKEHVLLPPAPLSVPPRFLSSFTSLAKTHENDIKYLEPLEGEISMQTMPRGPETGIIIHRIFEKIFSSSVPVWRNSSALDVLVSEQLRATSLASWKEPIQQMVKNTLTLPLQGDGEFFTLSELNDFQVEMEFIFSSSPHFVKGFIDLVFYQGNQVYFLDWKTNWLENYSPEQLQKAMKSHDYELQASLYSEAIRRHFKKEFGGSFYFFVRGGAVFHVSHNSKSGI